MVDVRKIIEIMFILRKRNNNAYLFFENILVDLMKPEHRDDAIKRLANCYSISQYSNFTQEEEIILGEIIDKIEEK